MKCSNKVMKEDRFVDGCGALDYEILKQFLVPVEWASARRCSWNGHSYGHCAAVPVHHVCPNRNKMQEPEMLSDVLHSAYDIVQLRFLEKRFSSWFSWKQSIFEKQFR